MVRVNQVIALGAVLALSLLTAQTALAGAAGAGGDSFTVVGPGTAASPSGLGLWTTSPTGGPQNLGEYTNQLSGPEEADYRFCASWPAGDGTVPVSVKAGPAGWLWFSNFNGTGGQTIIFGNPAVDTPTVMDTDGDGTDEIVVVRDESTWRKWIVRNTVESPVSNAASSFTFGPAGSTPVPGAWAGEGEADKPAVTKALGGGPIKVWLYGEPDSNVATGTFNFGKAEWNEHAYTGGDGVTRPGTAHRVGLGNNVIDVAATDDPADDKRVLMGGAVRTPVGNCNL